MINNFSQKIRSDIIQLSFKSKSAHLGSCLSLVEMLIAVVNFSKKNKSEIIFSKGHAAMAYYAILKNYGYIKNFSYENYLKKGSTRETDGINQQLIAAWDFVHIDLIIPM